MSRQQGHQRPKSRWSIKWSEKHIFKAEQEGPVEPVFVVFWGEDVGVWQSLGQIAGRVLSIQPIHGPVFVVGGEHVCVFFWALFGEITLPETSST